MPKNTLSVRLKQAFEQIPSRHDDAIGERVLANPDGPFSDFVPFSAVQSDGNASAEAGP